MRASLVFWMAWAVACLVVATMMEDGLSKQILVILLLSLCLGKYLFDLREGKVSSGLRSSLKSVGLRTEALDGMLEAFRRVVGPLEPLVESLVPEPGSAELRGRVMLASFFLGRDGREWTVEEIGDVLKATNRAVDWLAEEAGAWQVELKTEMLTDLVIGVDDAPRRPRALLTALEENDSALSDMEESAEVLRAASGIADRLGLCDLPTLIACLNQPGEVRNDSVVWLIHSLSQGQSHFLDEEQTDVPGVRLAVCYAREDVPDGPWEGPIFADPVTIVHELLHAFGATDKYHAKAGRYERGMVSQWEVMLLHHRRLSRLRIDALTATEIGWHNASHWPETIEKRNRRGGRSQRGGFE